MRTKEKRKLIILCAVLAALVVLAFAAERICIHDPYLVDIRLARQAPGGEYWLGTDALGRCMACRILAGLKYSLFSAVIIVGVTGGVGIILGIWGAYAGGLLDQVLLYINVVFQSFPGFVLAIFIAGTLGNGLKNGIFALCITGWIRYARLARTLALEVMHADYIKSARLSGLGFGAMVVQHILPNILMPLAVTMALSISDAVIGIAGLSFLGVGAAPPTPEWGTMIAEARTYLQLAPWTVIAPGTALFALVIIFNIFADTLQEVVDPQESKRNNRKRFMEVEK